MRALCHVSLAILSKLNHFTAHVRQLHIHPEGGKKRHIQRQSCQNMGRSKSSESQTTIPNRTHGDPDIAHFINTFLKTCRRYPWTTSDPIPVIDLLWAQPFWTRRHCYGAITPDSEPSLHGGACSWHFLISAVTLILTEGSFSTRLSPGTFYLCSHSTGLVLFFPPLWMCCFTLPSLSRPGSPAGMEWREPEPRFPLQRTMWGFQSQLGSGAFVLAPCPP